MYENEEPRMIAALIKRNLPKKFLSAKLSDFEHTFPETESLFITGSVGCGKTHLIAALMRNDIYRTGKGIYHRAYFTSMSALLFRIKNTYNQNTATETEQDVINHLCGIENLYIDDIGTDKVTDWNLSVLFHIVDHRYTNEMRTVFSSNYDLDNLNDKLGERVTSRIAGMCKRVNVSGKDRRL